MHERRRPRLGYGRPSAAAGGPVDLAAGGLATEGRGGRPCTSGTARRPCASTAVVVWAELAARPGDPAEGRATISEIVRWRRQHQPGGSNAGSVFVNPQGDAAGRLVESGGPVRGHRLGTARVSEKHANFIQADEGGSADDVARLIAEVQRRVAAHSGVALRSELQSGLLRLARPDAIRTPVDLGCRMTPLHA